LTLDTVDILDCRIDEVASAIVERFMKFRVIVVERVDIVERRLRLIVEEFEPIVVDRVDNAICVKEKVVDVFDPLVVDRVERAICVKEKVVDVFDPLVVDRVERAICVASKVFVNDVDRVDKLEPDTVDRKFTLLSI